MSSREPWTDIGVADICEAITDCLNRTAPTVDVITPYMMIRTTNVRDGWIDLSTVKYVDRPTYEKWTRRQVPRRGDIVLTREAPLGEVGIIRSDDHVFLGQRLVSYRVDPAKADERFLLYAFQERYLQGQIKALGSGATVEHMRVPDAKRLRVKLPPLPTQRRIASILSAYDDLIENNTRRIAILEEMARRLYEEWFVHFRFPGHEDHRLTESELGQVPESWEVKTVSDVFEVVGGGTPSKKEPEYWEGGAINWFSPTDLTRAGTSFMDRSGFQITDLGLSKSSARLFPARSVMMTSRATIGAIAINTTEACTNQGFITCIPSERFPLYVLFHWLNGNVETFVNLGTGATFKEITKGTFKTIPLVVPPVALAQCFEETVAPMMEQVLNLQRKNTNLRAQRDLLLPKLVSGEIDVSQAEKDLETAVA